MALFKFVVAMDESAIAPFIAGFSASRLKGFRLALSLSFFLSFDEELEKNEPDFELDLTWLKDWTVAEGCGKATGACEDEA